MRKLLFPLAAVLAIAFLGIWVDRAEACKRGGGRGGFRGAAFGPGVVVSRAAFAPGFGYGAAMPIRGGFGPGFGPGFGRGFGGVGIGVGVQRGFGGPMWGGPMWGGGFGGPRIGGFGGPRIGGWGW